MTAVLERVDITEPGLHPDLSDADYHAQRASLSSSGARKVLDCPVKFRYEQDHGAPEKATFDFGKVFHREVLGAGPDVRVVDAGAWTTKAAREERDDAYAMGAVPILAKDYAVILDMTAAVRRHDVAASLFDPAIGKPEQSLFHPDPVTGVLLRARYDHLDDESTGRLLIPDLKSGRSADVASIERACHDYGYAAAAAWYGDLAVAAGLCAEYASLLVVVEKTRPHVITVAQVASVALAIGRYRNRQAIDVYAECVRTGHWPGYVPGIAHVSLPGYIERAYFEEIQ